MKLLSKCIFFVFLIFSISAQAETEIPAFTSNIIDSANILTANDVQQIHQTIQNLHDKADIWPAVYIVDHLQDEKIEQLAERAFKKWQLGQAKKDNGLLLVIAMKDRKSRFEVGYGLEGDLTDSTTMRVLDETLRPLMRSNQRAQAVIQSLNKMALIRSGNSNLEAESKEKKQPSPKRLPVYLTYLVLIWFIIPLVNSRKKSLKNQLFILYPDLSVTPHTKSVSGLSPAIKYFLEKKAENPTFYGLQIFFSINPGCFVFFFAGTNILFNYALYALMAIIAVVYYRNSIAPYKSKEAFETFLQKQKKRHETMLNKGYMEEDYRSRSSSSPSSSSDSSSSSSGGGSSGGGGASSDW